MPTTTGRPERRQFDTADWNDVWQAPWTITSLRERGMDEYGLFAEERRIAAAAAAREASFVDGEYVPRPRDNKGAYAAIANALGVDTFEPLPKEGPPPVFAALDATPAVTEAPEASSGAYRVREGNWRERHGLPRRKKTVPPSRTPQARRARHLRELVAAGRYQSVEEADRATQRRQSFGKPKKKTREGTNAGRSLTRCDRTRFS